MESEEQINGQESPEQKEITSKFIKTAGGYDAIVQNGITIRKSDSKKRLHDDGETYEEYKIRLRLVDKMLKEYLRGKVVWNSRFSIKGQNYSSTYVKAKVEEALRKRQEEDKQKQNKEQ